MNKTYLFYDLETSGLNKCFDQILQFAAIRTDMKFNILEKYDFNLSLRDDIIISPEALLVHKISPENLMSGPPEYEAVCEIHELINQPGTISLGYNTLGFDDEFLRFSFYRNLLPPYNHQFKNGCFRMDVYPMAVFYFLFADHILKWPMKDGKVSLKLENLASLNNLASGRAHDALVDVEATVNLAACFAKEKKVWKYLADFFVKPFDQKRCESLNEVFQSAYGIHRVGIMVDGKLGSDHSFMAPFLCLGKSKPYSNQTLWLRLDQEIISTNGTDVENLYVVRKKYGEPPFILPFYDRFKNRLSSDQVDLSLKNLDSLKDKTDIFEQIADYHLNYRYPEIPDLDPDAALYEVGFMSSEQAKKAEKFHTADLGGKLNIVNGFDNFNKIIGKRILFRNYSDQLNLKEDMDEYFNIINPEDVNDAPSDYTGRKRLTPMEALAKIKSLLSDQELLDEDKKLLYQLEERIKNRFGFK